MTPEKARDRNYRTNYGITVKQYDRMLAQQNGVCACCGEPETDGPQGRNAPKMRALGKTANLAVDHDHKTGDVRSLLCGKCNKALGIMMEDPERIQKLKEYAEWCQQREPDKKIIQLRLID
jgi:ribosomal protein L34E